MSDEPLSVGVIGLGWQGASHLQNFAANPQTRLQAVCDIDEKRLTELADAYGVALRFTDYSELLDCGEVEAVVIVLPDHLHRDPAVAALEAGKHVLLEKPMALTVADAVAIAEAADQARGCFMLNLSNRFIPSFAKGKELLEGGKFGQVRYIFSRIANRIEVPTERLPWLKNSHPAHWIGVHRLDIARWYTAQEVSCVRAVQRKGVLTRRGIDAPDFFQATIEFEGGAVMSLEVNWILPASYPNLVDSRFYALCDDGVIDVDRFRSELMVAGPEGFELNTPMTGSVLGVQSGFTFAASRHFVHCCLSGRKPLVTAADGVALTRALCAIVESAESDGKPIRL